MISAAMTFQIKIRVLKPTGLGTVQTKIEEN